VIYAPHKGNKNDELKAMMAEASMPSAFATAVTSELQRWLLHRTVAFDVHGLVEVTCPKTRNERKGLISGDHGL